MMSSERFIVSPIAEKLVHVGRQNLQDEKLTSHPFNNTNLTMFSKCSFGNGQTELFTS
jgi:hypothetical protein